MGWILSRAKAKRNAKAPSILINAETPISLRVAIEEKFRTQKDQPESIQGESKGLGEERKKRPMLKKELKQDINERKE